MARLPSRNYRAISGDDVPPRLSPSEAARRLRIQLERVAEIRALPYNHPRYLAWVQQTRDLLNETFGKTKGEPDERTNDFEYGETYPFGPTTTPAERQRLHEKRLEYQVERLRTIIESLEESQVPVADRDGSKAETAGAEGIERWERLKPLEPLGAGGQGKVFLVTDRRGVEVSIQELRDAILRAATPALPEDARNQVIQAMRELIERTARSIDPARRGALKVLHDPKDARNPDTASQRLRREIAAMTRSKHPNLLRILDADPGGTWYVSEYHERGTLSKAATEFKGDVKGALNALRPLVEGVSTLHAKGIVHRDIKPANIFISKDGRLILGDFGLVLDTADDGTRLSGTFENVGSRDWMSPWTHGRRSETVDPDVDVYPLGKTLWSMVSGQPTLPFWYFDRAEFDLEKLFPDKQGEMMHVNALLAKCIVENKRQCLPDASALLQEIDAALAAIDRGAGKDGIRRMCVMCGRGTYRPIPDSTYNLGIHPSGSREFRMVACESCGHAQLHFRSGDFKTEFWPDHA